MSLPRRDSRQRKPSHFGSYCHSSPRGIASTERASIAAIRVDTLLVFRGEGGNGKRLSNTKHAPPTQTAGYSPAASRNNLSLKGDQTTAAVIHCCSFAF